MNGAIPQPGEIVAGKYEVVRFLGKGGMGVVLEARHRKLDQRVALKLLLPDAVERSDAVARFEREARAAAKLRSQHVVRVIDVDNDVARGGYPFIVMEYLEGHDLAYELRRRQFLPVPEAVDIMLQACIAMAEAHANGIVHRDIKPSNLFLEGAPHRSVVKVMDFGISKLVSVPGEGGETELTTTETALGTPSYMAPEQLTSSKTIDHRADIWALGVVAYRMLSGKLPFTADSSAALAVSILMASPIPLATASPQVPPALAKAIMSTLDRDAARRPQDAVAFGRLLAPFGTGAVPFEASVAGLPAPRARISDPQLAIVDATVRQSSPDVENAPTANAWSQRGAVAQPVPPRTSPLVFVAIIASAIAIAAVAGVVFVVKRPSAKTATSVVTSATSEPAPPPGSAADLPPPPSTAVMDEPASPVPAASSVAHATTRPVTTLDARPVRSAAPKPTATTAPAPTSSATKDPLHL